MTRFLTSAICALGMLAPFSASALVADLTDEVVWPNPTANPVTKLIGSVNVTVKGIPELNNNEELNRPNTLAFAGGFLAGDRDGFGVVSDEVIAGKANPESIEVTFNQLVRIQSLAFLDLFDATANQAGRERVVVTFFEGATLKGSATFDAVASQGTLGYGAFASGFDFTGVDKLIFEAAVGPSSEFQDDGNNDFALAAIEFSVIPLPAPAFLLIGALGGFAALRRRQRTA